MSDKIKELIEYHSESHLLDFKREQYILGKNPKKHELLKDISAMANHPSNDDKYIIIGVIEKDGVASGYNSLENIEDEAKYQEYLKSNIEPEINFEYKTFQYNGFKLAYFRIFGNDNRPYLFKNEIIEDNKIKYHKGAMVIRIGTKTDRVNRANLDNIYEAKYSQKDRKSDLILSFNVKERIIQFVGSNHKVKILELSVENISNKSISFLIEMKIEKKNNIDIKTTLKIQEEIAYYRESNSNYSQFNTFTTPIFNMNAIKIIDSDEYKIISRIKNGNHEKEIIIPQKATKEDVFDGDLILTLHEQKITLNLEVRISSDDFTSGPLIKRFSLDIEDGIVANTYTN